jgi:hypothetical protein
MTTGVLARWLAVASTLLACRPPAKPVEPAVDPTQPVIDEATYDSKIAGLRATLARSAVALETQPVIRSCNALDARGCMRCDLATRAQTGGVDPDLIDGVAIALARYPTKVLAAAHLEHVALCRKIRFDHDDDGTPPAGLAQIGERRILISVEQFIDSPGEYFTIEQVVHHEVFHLLDHAVLGDKYTDDDREWNALNPPGFAYRDPAANDTDKPPAGFVNSYATTNEREDRATVFEYLIGQPKRLCELAEHDPIVAGKIAMVWSRIAKLTGDDLLRRSAPCAARFVVTKKRKPSRAPTRY